MNTIWKNFPRMSSQGSSSLNLKLFIFSSLPFGKLQINGRAKKKESNAWKFSLHTTPYHSIPLHVAQWANRTGMCLCITCFYMIAFLSSRSCFHRLQFFSRSLSFSHFESNLNSTICPSGVFFSSSTWFDAKSDSAANMRAWKCRETSPMQKCWFQKFSFFLVHKCSWAHIYFLFFVTCPLHLSTIEQCQQFRTLFGCEEMRKCICSFEIREFPWRRHRRFLLLVTCYIYGPYRCVVQQPSFTHERVHLYRISEITAIQRNFTELLKGF